MERNWRGKMRLGLAAAVLLLVLGRLLGPILASSLAPPIPVSARQLALVYRENPVNGDRLYQGQLLALQGRILAIEQDDLGRPYLLLEGGTGLKVQCFFLPNQLEQLAGLRPNRAVSLSGLCRGYRPGPPPLVVLTSCLLEPHQPP